MVKKYVLILFFLISYLTMELPSFAETHYLEKNNEEERIDENKKSNPREKQVEKNDIDEESDPLKMHNGNIDSDLTCTKDIPFTVAQKKRLDQIYHRIYMDYIDLIETYAWSGALTQDQKLIRYKMLKNYVLTFQKRNYKWCSEFEEDEWEEEWFNSDND
ncbi:hypothetical protein BACCIP111895_00237 [Neobacillus rhizosphaerae]|uniref:DUF2680 domain-containing protein n=1 Tax=Neobacillus rhizosphaerae TaxID=2880965 RepID=A0ABN8KM31_9BACI|nr:DUF2680 domain-containing protein [Neobacillus rhizosphaerae]CAH2713104.1 hypothetical protein BACCIP111895_00237 [Neobacillus rhizosphaerae]